MEESNEHKELLRESRSSLITFAVDPHRRDVFLKLLTREKQKQFYFIYERCLLRTFYREPRTILRCATRKSRTLNCDSK